MSPRPVGYGRRGSVLILVIGILAMLFVLGSTQLMVARFERRTAEERRTGNEAKDASLSAVISPAATLSEDVIGLDATAYNRGWSLTETSLVEDSVDFLGLAIAGTDDQRRVRSGDLSLSSLEPYNWGAAGWQFYAMSWNYDAATALTGWPPATPVWPNPWTGGWPTIMGPDDLPYADSDGDGFADSRFMGYVAGCAVYQRIVPHGGMVTLDRMTHPALLAQVIHPRDGTLHLQPWQLFNSANWVAGDNEEYRLRRRFMLPGSVRPDTPDWQALPTNDLRKLMPYTLGYRSPVETFTAITPHWYRVNAPGTDPATEKAWFTARMTPGVPLASATPAQKNADMYDRRHLLTTRNSDDLLRPNRNEKLLYGAAGAVDETTLAIRQLFYVLNPTAEEGLDGTVLTQPPQAYGVVGLLGGGQTLAFNKPGLRTQFSLRDVLDRTAETGTITQAMQLTAYYLAMLQNTATTSGMTAVDQLRMAAQLAVNTIDYADADTVPTWFAYFAPGGSAPVVEVVGLEKQPYITEAYAKVVRVYDSTSGTSSTSAGDCVFGVELYNPYPVPLDLTGYQLNGISLNDLTITTGDGATAWSGFIPAYSYLVFVNQAADPTGNILADNYPFTDTAKASQLVILPDLSLTPAVSSGLNYAKLERMSGSVALLTNSAGYTAPSSYVVDQLGPQCLDGVTLGEEPGVEPDMATPYTVRHTSLQRHKERQANAPITWHFTLALQKGFDSEPAEPQGAADLAPELFAPEDYHNLLFTGGVPNGSNFEDNALLCKTGDPSCDPSTAYRFHHVPPMQIVVADSGLDLTTFTSPTGAAAFPTTGSLLLVTANGHTSYLGTSTANVIPLTVFSVYGDNNTVEPAETERLMRVDHNRFPMWDTTALCSDIQPDVNYGNVPQSRFDMPWGQLVFTYFTALPLHELTHVDFIAAANPVVYENNYIQAFGNGAVGYTLLPLVDRVLDAPSPYGPRVRGRVNINFAPWWVLDGLPVLPGDVVTAGYKPTTGVPVPEASPAFVDPNWTSAPVWPNAGAADFELRAGQRPAQYLAYRLFDTNVAVNANFETISPDFANYIEAFREKQNRPGMIDVGPGDAPYIQNPGYLTTGALCNVISRVQVPAYAPGTGKPMGLRTLGDLRTTADPDDSNPIINARRRPFSYLGYSQMVAPLVRIKDWTTVRTHVYTVYNLIGDGNGTWLRSQTTIDRTRSLYTNDLPERVAQSEPIDYFNTVGDQR